MTTGKNDLVSVIWLHGPLDSPPLIDHRPTCAPSPHVSYLLIWAHAPSASRVAAPSLLLDASALPERWILDDNPPGMNDARNPCEEEKAYMLLVVMQRGHAAGLYRC